MKPAAISQSSGVQYEIFKKPSNESTGTLRPYLFIKINTKLRLSTWKGGF